MLPELPKWFVNFSAQLQTTFYWSIPLVILVFLSQIIFGGLDPVATNASCSFKKIRNFDLPDIYSKNVFNLDDIIFACFESFWMNTDKTDLDGLKVFNGMRS